ncbi:NGF factor, partial [Polyodon spathula]|nr:venom nerve growth factor-like [Polyodon spathula]XP_041083100.1 venom nerve growth factor-like [Polyodon spathula]XP_041083101.1 venom nerve growth factor-like [Polyodon spathula]MBN3277090.1 NGF factor [Polyodon spathula]
MWSSTLVLVFLIGVQAVLKSEGDARVAGAGLSSRQQGAPDTMMAQLEDSSNQSQSRDQNLHSPKGTSVDPKLFSKQPYRSPRVLFSSQPPGKEGAEAPTGSRVKRKASPALHRGEYSVCDSVSTWVGDKTKATDIKGQEVSVLAEVNINNTVIKQYFFETTCRNAKQGGAGCRGIDRKHWNSYCTDTHTFVRALTVESNLVAWRFIRINTACACVLSRKSWRH